ncbi:rapamycin-insensitive companion of mTOR [Trichonephila clavipes]|nr:rapamycin-insensitive companion of mTOR [Trichonephila clavipes]
MANFAELLIQVLMPLKTYHMERWMQVKSILAQCLHISVGLMYLCRSNACHLQSLVEMLYLPYPDLRKNVLDLLYKIFDISIPEWTDDFSIALNSSDPSALKPSWQLYEGYIVAEGLDVLPYSSKDRTNLVYNYHALLVLVFVNCGLLEALSEVIVTSEVNLAVRTTVFLGEFIYMGGNWASKLPAAIGIHRYGIALKRDTSCWPAGKQRRTTSLLYQFFIVHRAYLIQHGGHLVPNQHRCKKSSISLFAYALTTSALVLPLNSLIHPQIPMRCQVICSQFGLAIYQNDHQARRRFVEWAQNKIAVVPDFHKRILFSDEAHFWLNGYVNKQNCHIWSEANPQVYVETQLHPEKLTVWCALWAGGIIGPYFFKNDEGHNVTVNGDRYRAMITNFFIPELNNHDVQELWFQQDGATCHTAHARIDLLKDTFGEPLFSRFGPVNWPPRSCDLTPLDYFLWGYVKSLVYADKPQALDHLEHNILRVIVNIRPQMLEKVIENWTSRLDYIRASRGSPMPEIIFKIQATAALTCLFRIHELKKKGAVPNSLVLSNLLHICNPDREKKGFFVGTVNKIKLWKYLKQEMTNGIDQAIRDTLVLSKDYQCWDWDLIDCILKNPSDSFKRLEDTNHRTFIKKLLQFFKPSSKEFSEMEFDKENGRSICVTGCHLLEFFLELDEIKAQEYLDDFLNDLNNCFVQLTKDGDRLNSILSPIKVSSTFSQIYFLFIGKLSSTHKGCKFLNRCSTFQSLFHLVSVTNQDIYIKLIVSSLDYTKEGFSRAILTKVLTGTEEATRLYATNFLLILLRAKLPDYRKWAIEVLVYQLHDSSKLVSAAALDILDEACTIQENLEALISLRPSLLQLGDKGLLLLVRYLSVQSGFNFLQESNFLCCELERWQQVYNYKYVKVVEDLLNEAFTHHRRGIEGTYGRRSSDMSHSVRNVYLPPHMYGQLVQHAEGVKVLQNNGVLPELFHNIRYPNFSTDMAILHLKASLWAVGHIGSYSLGLRIIIKENLILNIVDLAASAPVFAVRGTCYFVLGLLSSTIEGADALREYGWETVQRNHEEKWPLIKEEFLIDASQMARKSTWSFSSMSSDWPLGALPTSLSFIVRTSQFDLTRSQSQISNTSTEDILQNSCINLQTHYNSFADPDSTSNNSRPRSSSDCQTDTKENALSQVAESSSWDALNSYSSFTLPVDFKRYTKRRSISTSEVEIKTFDFRTESNVEEVDENEVTNSKVAFFHADEDLPEPKQHSLSHSNVHPVASESSINSSKSSDGCVERPSLLKQLSRGHSLHLHSPVSPDKPSSLLLTSARDALGYATLKDIQRRRVNSLSFHDASSTQVDVSLRYLKSQSLDADSAKVFNVPNDLLFTQTEEDSIKSRNLSQDTDTVESRFIGLCLPSNLDFILHVPKHSDEPESEIEIVPPKSDAATNSKDPDSAFEFHSEDNCISNHSFADKRSLQRTIIDEESEEQSSVTVKSNEDSICKKILPLERSNSVKATRGLLATDHIILNHGQVTWITPELAPPLLTTTPHQQEDVSALDRFNVHRCPTRQVFSGTMLELVTMQATVRYLYHSATAATEARQASEDNFCHFPLLGKWKVPEIVTAKIIDHLQSLEDKVTKKISRFL